MQVSKRVNRQWKRYGTQQSKHHAPFIVVKHHVQPNYNLTNILSSDVAESFTKENECYKLFLDRFESKGVDRFQQSRDFSNLGGSSNCIRSEALLCAHQRRKGRPQLAKSGWCTTQIRYQPLSHTLAHSATMHGIHKPLKNIIKSNTMLEFEFSVSVILLLHIHTVYEDRQ